MVEIKDTSQDYDDLVGYVAKENVRKGLSEFIDDNEDEYRVEAPPRKVDPEFPEEWQSMYVNFRNEEDYIKFMKLIDEVPVPNLREFVYRKDKDMGLLNFLGD